LMTLTVIFMVDSPADRRCDFCAMIRETDLLVRMKSQSSSPQSVD